MEDVSIIPLTQDTFTAAAQLVLDAQLDTRQEIEHHLAHINAHYIAVLNTQVIGVIGWYQDNVQYADKAMGDLFPGQKAFWVGFFAVDPKYRGKGIGAQLLHKLESILKEKQANELWVSSVPETKSYYERHGFQLVMQGEINGNPKFFLKKSLR